MKARNVLACCVMLALLTTACAEVTDPLDPSAASVTLDVFVPAELAGSVAADASSDDAEALESGSWWSMRLLPCPGPKLFPVSSSALIGPEGGVLERGPFTLSIPAGALTETHLVTLTRPPIDLLLLEATVGDQDHYEFAKPVDFTVNVSKHCPWVTSEWLSLLRSVWIDAPGGARLVGSTPEAWSGKIKFSTDHFSSYGIAW